MSIQRNPDLLNHEYTFNPENAHRPVVLLVHGLMGDLNNLGVIGRHLNKYFNILKIDLANHGKSFFRDVMEYPLMVADIIKVLNHLNIKQVIAVGHSMGGKVVMRLAFEHPEIVRELIVIDMAPVHYKGRRHDDVFAALNAVKDANCNTREECKAIIEQYLTDAGVKAFVLKSFNPDEPSKFIFNAPVLQAEYDHIGIWEESLYQGKSLFVYGLDSPYVNDSERKQAIYRQFPNNTLIGIENCGHWVHADQPKKLLNTISDFLVEADELQIGHELTRYQ